MYFDDYFILFLAKELGILDNLFMLPFFGRFT